MPRLLCAALLRLLCLPPAAAAAAVSARGGGIAGIVVGSVAALGLIGVLSAPPHTLLNAAHPDGLSVPIQVCIQLI